MSVFFNPSSSPLIRLQHNNNNNVPFSLSFSSSSSSLVLTLNPNFNLTLITPPPTTTRRRRRRPFLPSSTCRLQQHNSSSTGPPPPVSVKEAQTQITTTNQQQQQKTKVRHWKVGEYPPPPAAASSSSNPNASRRIVLSNNTRRRRRDSPASTPNPTIGLSNTNSRRRDNHNNNSTPRPKLPVVGGSSGFIKNIKKKMDRKANAKAWVNTVTESLSHLILNKQWFRALEVFEMLKEQPFYQPREGTYMKLLVLLGRCGQCQRAQQLFDSMLGEDGGLDPTPQLYTALLAAYCRSGLIRQAFSVLDQMKALPLCQPDVYTYSILIKACVDASQFDLLQSLYSQMADRSITPNTVTQNSILSGYGKAGMFDQVEEVLAGMLGSTSSAKPDVWTMNTILSLFGNKGEIEMMEKWYEKFRNFGIDPETRTFNILIGAYGKKRMYDKMSSVMEYMRKLSFPWTTSTYNNVIEAFSDSGDAKHMEYTFDQMRAEGIKADTKTFCCLIRGYANAGLFHKVIATVQLAGNLEIPENTLFYNAIIFACAKAEDMVEMERVFKRMKDKHCQPDSTTYSVMVDTYRKQGMTDKVYDLELERQTMTMATMVDAATDEILPGVDEVDLET